MPHSIRLWTRRAALSCLALSAMVAGLGAPAHAADKIRFLNDWLPAGDKGAIYYGVQKGFFSAVGIEVEINSGRGSSDVVTKLASGSADFGTGGLGALLQARAEQPVGVKGVSSIYTMQPDAIFTTEGTGVTKLSDIAGKTIATATFSSSNVIWPLLLQANGIPEDRVKLLKVDPGALAPMLASGRVQGTINWVTVAPLTEDVLKQAGKTLTVLPWSEYGFKGYGLSLFASDDMLTKKPDVARKFVAAYLKATAAAIKDPAGVAAALKAMVPEVDLAVSEAAWKASIPLMQNDISAKDGMGAFDHALLAETWSWVARAGNMPTDKLDPELAVTRDFLPK